MRDLVERMLKTSGRRVDVSSPFVDAMLPSGHRLHVVLDGITRGFSAVNIRKFVVKASRLRDLVELGTLTAQAAEFLDACVVAGLNIMVAGGTQAGRQRPYCAPEPCRRPARVLCPLRPRRGRASPSTAAGARIG